MDWREMAGRPTVRGIYDSEKWGSYSWAWSGGKILGFIWREDQLGGGLEPMRGWIIAFCWIIACLAEYVCYLPPRNCLNDYFAVSIISTFSSADRGLSSTLL